MDQGKKGSLIFVPNSRKKQTVSELAVPINDFH